MNSLPPGLDTLLAMFPEDARHTRSEAQSWLRVGLPRPAPRGHKTVSRHLIAPHPNDPRLLIPRAPRAVVQSSLHLYRPQRPVAQAVRAGLVPLAGLGITGRLPGFELALVSERGAAIQPSRLWRDVEATLPGARHWAASTGTPGPFRKASVRIMDHHGVPLGQVKLGPRGPAARRIATEAVALRSMTKLQLTNARIPELLSQGGDGAHAWMIQQHLGDDPVGAPNPKSATVVPRPSTEQVAAFCEELQGRTTRWMRLDYSAFWRSLHERASDLPEGPATEAWRRLCIPLAGRLLPLTVLHGDLAIYNVMMRDGRLVVFDWETYRPQGPPLADLCHWMLYEAMLLDQRTPDALVGSLLNGDDAVHAQALLRTASTAGDLPPTRHDEALPPLTTLVALYLVDRIATLQVEQRDHPRSDRAAQIDRLQSATAAVLTAAS